MAKKSTKNKTTTLRRYQPAGIFADSARERTQVLSAHVPRNVAITLVNLFDAWAKALKYKPVGANTANKTREQIASRSTGVKLGFSVTQQILTDLENQAQLQDRKKNFLATRAITEGADGLTTEELLNQYAAVRPSLSLVTLLAFSRGWQATVTATKN